MNITNKEMRTSSIKGRSLAEVNAALLDTMTDLSRKLELDQLLSSVLERAVSLIGVTGGELAIYHEAEKELEVVASYELGMNSAGLRLALGEGAMGMVAQTQDPLVIPDYLSWEGRSNKYAETTVRSVMVVPLIAGDKLVGTFAGVHLEEKRSFDQDDLDLLNMFAPLAATAIDNARLFEAEKRKAEEQKALLDTMTDLSRKLELGQLLASVLERAVSLLQVTGGELAIYHDDTKELEVVASHNLGMDSIGVRLKLGEGVMGRVAASHQPVIIPDYQTWEGRSDKYAQTIVRSVIMVPLILGDQLVGAIGGIHLEEGRKFNNSDLRLLNLFAPLAATAIENARLFKRTNGLLQEAEYRAAELKRTQDQLVQQEKLASLGELTAGIAHEIQNPLNFVNNFSDVNTELIDEVREALEKGDQEEAIEILNALRQNMEKTAYHGKRADAIVKNMLQHSRAGSGKKEPTDINALADEYLRLSFHGMRAKERAFNAELQTAFAEMGPIQVVKQDIGRVLLNLFNNAFYALNEKLARSAADFQPLLCLSTRCEDGKVFIHISDNGTGIPEKVLNKIWQPFFTTKPTGEGTGLGLSLSYDIITKGHGGDMQVHTQQGEGTEFIIELPCNNNEQ